MKTMNAENFRTMSQNEMNETKGGGIVVRITGPDGRIYYVYI